MLPFRALAISSVDVRNVLLAEGSGPPALLPLMAERWTQQGRKAKRLGTSMPPTPGAAPLPCDPRLAAAAETRPIARIFSESSLPLRWARRHVDSGPLTVTHGSIMVHMDGFNQNEPSHVETMRRALARMSLRFPAAGLVLQLGDRFYEHSRNGLREVQWASATPPPVVTRMSAINLIHHGRCVLVEGDHLHVTAPPAAGQPRALDTPQQALCAGAGGGLGGAQLEPEPDPPLVLYCIQAGVLQAEKLRPMYSTPDGRKALFAAPLQALPLKGSVTLRLRRGHAFSQDVTMTTTWLQERRPPLQQGL